MSTETNFNVSPWFDDFNETKNFHRVLFKPATAVQARELIQLQTILQNQIERFGNAIYKDGSIIQGCAISFFPTLHYTRLPDHDTDGSLFDVTGLVGTLVESANNGLQAQILTVSAGTEINYPDTNRVYVRYVNSGNNAAKVFANTDTLVFYTGPRSANVIVATTNTFSNVAANTSTADIASGLAVSDGIVYQKGFFVRVQPQTVVVSDSLAFGNTVVGFVTNESVVTSDQDTSLLDNALGYSNENAPGADRLKLTANLQVISGEAFANSSNFNPIVQYVAGLPVMENPDPQYSRIGDEMGRRSTETNGSFIIKPFTVDTVSHPSNTSLLQARVSPGTGYAQGTRVELTRQTPVNVVRGIDTGSADAQLITTNYANYVLVKEYAGVFDFTNCEEVEIWSAYQTVLTNHSAVSATAGAKIGVANIRTVKYISGTPGTPSAQYAVYLFNIRMNTGQSFTSAKSLYFNGTNKGVADLVDGKIYNAERRTMIWNFGKSALKSLTDASGTNHTQYQFRQKGTTTIAIDGTAPLVIPSSHGTGTNQFAFGNGVVGDGNETSFVVTALSNGQTANMAGTVTVTGTSNTVVGSGTNFTAHFSVGEYIKLGSAGTEKRITAINSATSLQVDSNFGPFAANTYTKYFPAGYVFPLTDTMVGTRNVNITSSTTATVNVGSAVTGQSLQATIPVAVYYDIIRSNTKPAAKVINKNVLVQIDTATNSAGANGPWILGVADVHKITAVYAGSTYSNTNPNYLSRFTFSTGQTDTHYDLGKLALRPGQTLPGTKLLVQLDCFTPNQSPGVGFFTVESYPIDDANSANTTAISTADIPVFVSETGGTYALRDSVDFRPYKTNTANLVTPTTNPGPSSTFVVDSVGMYVPSPDENFEASISYYLGRRDMIYFTNMAQLKVQRGAPSERPKTPSAPDDSMPVVVVNIPPYPSLTAPQQDDLTQVNRIADTIVRDTSSAITVSLVTNRRYTMRDIGILDNRISRLEYYTTLNLLEKAATDINVADANGLNRFKNGIFAEPFNTHALGDVSNPEYKIAIDEDLGIARPYFVSETANLRYNTALSGTVKNSKVITLPFTTMSYATQPFATKVRNAAPVAFQWSGHAQLFPNYDHFIDKVNAPAVHVTLDLASAWQDFANSPFGAQYGDWRSQSAAQSVVAHSAVADAGGVMYTDVTTTTTTTVNQREGQKIGVNVTNTDYNLGNYVSDIAVLPYIRSREIGFCGWGLRPLTRVYVAFDKESVDAYCAMGVPSGLTDTSDDRYVTRTAAWGTPLTTDAFGRIYGKFIIPDGKFRVGERNFEISDQSDLNIGMDATTTKAVTTFVGSGFAVQQNGITLTAVTPELTFNGVSESNSQTSVSQSVSQTYVPNPPPPPPPVKPCYNFAAAAAMWGDQYHEVKVYGASNWFSIFVTGGYAGYMSGAIYGPGDPCGYAAIIGDIQAGFEMDPMAQAFRVQAPNNAAGLFMTSLDLYFQKKPSVQTGVTVYLCEMNNGYPNASKIIPYSRVHYDWNQINVSNDGTAKTTFNFEAPVYLSNAVQYAFVVMPDGNNPDYLIWMAELGSQDVKTGATVFSQPFADTAFLSANHLGWTALQNEYVKFGLNHAYFQIEGATAAFDNAPIDYIKIGTGTYVNSSAAIRAGDLVVGANAVSDSTKTNTAIYGRVINYDRNTGAIHLDTTTGNWQANSTVTSVQIHRTATDTIAISNATLVAGAPLLSVDNLRLNAAVVRFATLTPPGTSLDTGLASTSTGYAKSGYEKVSLDNEHEYFDYERIIASRSNENLNMGGTKSVSVSSIFYTDNPYVSPLIDMSRANVMAIGNLIDPLTKDLVKEYGNSGDVQTKYISKTVVMADGQDAEDLKIYLTAYRPTSADVLVYAKFLSAEDSNSIKDKPWTLLTIDNGDVYSSYRDVTDYREYVYSIPASKAASAPTTVATLDPINGITYTDATGSTYHSFKQFAIKIILLSDSTARVPRLNDARAIALQM